MVGYITGLMFQYNDNFYFIAELLDESPVYDDKLGN
jgi:hypothetical protein